MQPLAPLAVHPSFARVGSYSSGRQQPTTNAAAHQLSRQASAPTRVSDVLIGARQQLERARSRQLPPHDPWRKAFDLRQADMKAHNQYRSDLLETVRQELAALPSALPPLDPSGRESPSSLPVSGHPLPGLDENGALSAEFLLGLGQQLRQHRLSLRERVATSQKAMAAERQRLAQAQEELTHERQRVAAAELDLRGEIQRLMTEVGAGKANVPEVPMAGTCVIVIAHVDNTR
jgi:hypothetical protein